MNCVASELSKAKCPHCNGMDIISVIVLIVISPGLTQTGLYSNRGMLVA